MLRVARARLGVAFGAMTSASATRAADRAPVLDRVVGQDAAVALLRASAPHPVHAYLFLGPPGTGRLDAAAAFAAALNCPDGGCGHCEVCEATLARRHPDYVVVERQGASISVAQANEVARLAIRSPRAAPYQVLVLVDFHLVGAAAPALLKTIEEPPPSTVIIVVAETVPPAFVTIASRCLQVPFERLDDAVVAEVLVREGTPADEAPSVASAAAGRLDRARVLAADPGFAERLQRWRSVPTELDGTGARVVQLAQALLAGANEPVEVVTRRQQGELEQLAAEAKLRGERGLPGRQAIEDRHKREQRRVRTDDLRAGLSVLAGGYRDRLGAEQMPAQRLATTLSAIEAIDDASSRLDRNVNEALVLEWLLLRLDS